FEFCSTVFCDAPALCDNLFIEHIDFRAVKIANFQAEHDLAGNYVRRAGKCLNATDGSDLSTGNAGNDLIYRLNELRGCKKSIVSFVHRCRAGVICKSFDSNIPPLDADDSFDNSNVEFFGFEHSTLLDVKLDISENVAALALDCRQSYSVAANEIY